MKINRQINANKINKNTKRESSRKINVAKAAELSTSAREKHPHVHLRREDGREGKVLEAEAEAEQNVHLYTRTCRMQLKCLDDTTNKWLRSYISECSGFDTRHRAWN
ncbi:uncharacterized protein [Penaeus vannamei]|uniref:uncharacterized protein n=1 Tax=Penaeus vannamei TaxID=6689 RepID=UPI00387F6D0C